MHTSLMTVILVSIVIPAADPGFPAAEPYTVGEFIRTVSPVLVSEGGILTLGMHRTLLGKKKTRVCKGADLLAARSILNIYNQGGFNSSLDFNRKNPQINPPELASYRPAPASVPARLQ